MRIDKYLKVERVIKRRTVANELCNNEKVFVNGKVVKAHYEVAIGDEILIKFGERIITHKVEKIAEIYKKRNK